MIIRLRLTDNWQLFEPNTKQWIPASVPGCAHTDLLRNQLIPDPFWGANEWQLQWLEHAEWKYTSTFSAPPELFEHENIELVADGLDTLATLFLNGKKIGETENMFVGYRFPVKQYLQPGANELRIEFAPARPYIEAHLPGDFYHEANDRVGGCSAIRKQQCQFGWDWGPRLVTAGIYKDLRLEAWSANRIDSVRIVQAHRGGEVGLSIFPDAVNEGANFQTRLLFKGRAVAESFGLELSIPDPELWWPNGLGAQPLYDLEIDLLHEGKVVDRISRRIGFREIELDRHPDEWGESFQFKVNGVPIFAKGANWIPAHAFVTEANHELYDDLLTSAREANMNMLRVWGGGIYEMDAFYDLCDEKGLLVWQDFMYACALYGRGLALPSQVDREAEYQVKRLSHRACLALWCGNNEIEQAPQEITRTRERKIAYDELFNRLLPEVVRRFDGVTPYWPSSPHNPDGYEHGFNNERAGDCHFWDVWHARYPVKRYEEKQFRFCSEFGMQSYSSPEVAKTFCRAEEFNVLGPAMENHQKNSAGNQIIFDYVSRRYRFPKDYASLAYLSQLNQAFCLKIGVEHFRRIMPRCMGALYWQLNDCWLVFSWSSIEFGGKWKALHYEAKRFFSPVLVSAHVPGDEKPGIANYLESSIHEVNLYTVYDGVGDQEAALNWALYHLDGRILDSESKEVTLRYGESVLQRQLGFSKEMALHGASNLVLRVWLEMDGKLASQNTVFLTSPRFLNLTRGKIDWEVRPLSAGRVSIGFRSAVFQHAVQFELPGIRFRACDNYFDLFPGITHHVEVATSLSTEEVRSSLQTMSLVDSYSTD